MHIMMEDFNMKGSVNYQLRVQIYRPRWLVLYLMHCTPYGDLADGGIAAVVSWLVLDAVFPSEIIASRPTEKLPDPRSWRRSSRRVADAFYTAERIRIIHKITKV
ncbi:hypothetical protein EAI_06366 [Harpegnathos saltator]|uniref:Uncharacterized protein n=1 Tax=Harpegnathos saltator TaxID=610380 RepID=E2BGI0_HARSA|nr:hypothetical protein EAI_06366 [Harpegnathos saltator]